MDEVVTQRAVRAAREVAHSASQLASEAAMMARLYEPHGARDASLAATEASIRAAKAALSLDTPPAAGMATGENAQFDAAIRASLASLEAAMAAVGAARAALDVISHSQDRVVPVDSSGAGSKLPQTADP